MKRCVAAAALALVGAGLAFQGPAAAASLPQSEIAGRVAEEGSIVHRVHWRRCRYWRRECAFRWGWGTWRWRRCLIIHGCW